MSKDRQQCSGGRQEKAWRGNLYAFFKNKFYSASQFEPLLPEHYIHVFHEFKILYQLRSAVTGSLLDAFREGIRPANMVSATLSAISISAAAGGSAACIS